MKNSEYQKANAKKQKALVENHLLKSNTVSKDAIREVSRLFKGFESRYIDECSEDSPMSNRFYEAFNKLQNLLDGEGE